MFVYFEHNSTVIFSPTATETIVYEAISSYYYVCEHNSYTISTHITVLCSIQHCLHINKLLPTHG